MVKSSQRILIADDDRSIRDLLASVVEAEGYTPVMVDDGRKAYRTLQTDADFRAGIFDMVLPNLPGLDLISYMKSEKRLQRIPVMMTTANINIEQTAKGFRAGAAVLLPKPFTAAQLQTTLRMLLTMSAGTLNSQN
jgi:DNA-binding response OmpR family regulator